ncbi:Transglycosylase SLT domain-containing protein [Shimia gijangensis]|uniref:Transglycosylase SLT domain-containing protein n=2 Tax=Shimia gijangensis TaxID=1470563 RepID=A0A1M6D030_9RHOB|nr:lytic transglycosylase domain-containing protein [Shimia gijangensis]SHI66463.1 Transglycosylase SLT domain-containing protein [Shimia gijangensis]
MKLKWRVGVCLAVALFVQPMMAESPPPFADFSAKRVKAPPKGAKPKIDVQITIQDTVVTVSKPQSSEGASSTPGQYGWFWDEISPDIAESGGGRLEPALIRLSRPPEGQGVKAPRLQSLLEIAQKHGTDILIATVGTQVSPALVLAMIAVESSGDKDAQSGAGAQGLMQLMPVTSQRFDVEDPFDSAQNIKGGVAFLEILMSSFDRDPILVLAGYNAGENAVRKANGVPEYAETRDYVPKVLVAYSVARGLCRTPPQLITDGCVFALN